MSPKANNVLLQILQKSKADFSWLQRASGAPAKVTGHANSPVTTTLRPWQGPQECLPPPIAVMAAEPGLCCWDRAQARDFSPSCVAAPKGAEAPSQAPQNGEIPDRAFSEDGCACGTKGMEELHQPSLLGEGPPCLSPHG